MKFPLVAAALLCATWSLAADNPEPAKTIRVEGKDQSAATDMKAAAEKTTVKAGAMSPESKLPDHGSFTPADVKWGDAPPSLPPGAKMAVLEGDPKAPGPFTMRALLPDGYKVMPHWHPGTEHVTVISGTLHLGMGDKFDQEKGQALPAGSFTFMPAKMQHYAWATGETVIQVHGIGPWGITYVNPADDPTPKPVK